MNLIHTHIPKSTPMQWAIIDTPYGCSLVVKKASDGVICLLCFGDDLQGELSRLPYSNLSEAEDVGALEAELGRAFGGGECDLEVALDVTDFRFDVLKVLTQKVGFGQTVTYGELARLSGCPKAVRAAASALAANPVAGLIPCHRVNPKAGGVGQYRWGAAVKAKIQNYEKSIKR